MGIKADERDIFNLSLSKTEETNKRLEKIFENTLERTEAKIIKLRTDLLKGGVVKPFSEQRLLVLQKNVNEELVKLRGETRSVIRSGYIDNYRNTYYLSAWAYEKEINTGLNLGFDYFLGIPELDMNTVRASFDQRIGGHVFNDRTLRNQRVMQFALQDAIAQNIIEGESVKSLSKNLDLIEDVFQQGLNNTTRIARTELLKAYSIGQEQSVVEAEKSGVEFNYIWKATLDSRVRPDHAREDQKEALIIDGEPIFTVGGIRFSSPRLPVSPTGSKQEAKQVINCRCRRQNLPFGIKPTKRVAKKKDGTWETVNGDLTAREWVKKEYGITLK